MRILFVMPRFPCPPDRGDKVRPYHFARVLSSEHTLGLVSFVDSPISQDDKNQANGLFSYVKTVQLKKWSTRFELLKNMFSSKPWQLALFRSPEMSKTIEQAISAFAPDVIYTFHLRMAQYTMGIKGIYRILDLTDAVSLFLHRMLPHRPLYLRPLIWREERAVRKYETELASHYDEVWLISNVDAEAIPGAEQWENLVIIPNGVDAQYFSPSKDGVKEDSEKESRIIFVGFMGVESVSAVLYFYSKIYPQIKQVVPNVRFMIVGKEPPESVKRLSQDPSVEVFGYAPDLAACYRNATVSIAPMKFVVGIQNKVLESMACGIPVVATSCAHEGIKAEHGQEIFVADNEEKFAKLVCDLLLQPELREKTAVQARDFVMNNYRWERVVEHLGQLTIAKKINEDH